ncbi:glycosidase [Mycobacterium antarcticum]|uniref:glycoside hydrolase family 130 protein n=1 Tax=unclassified Mycolicibacterium TaxID=2636767 RepID=UPI00239F46E0|nr:MULTISPECIES: glycoside hydrolase family 130 protein [unclassified Mycolicibacterium]BDX33511.1 glycosidase [Mycolicibacterium sp. TUM20985]GLP82878.1 glycosidase [Mycolicibacterium sp. TUM20984]
MTSVQSGLATRTPIRLLADPSRVVIRLFIPGQEGFEHQETRAGAVLRRILALDDQDVTSSLKDVVARFGDRHPDLAATFRRHARELSDRLNPADELTESRSLLLGAAFTSEYAIEGAALCNPSMVAHPDQSGIDSGSVRFVMSVRGIGEGHLSSIGFRTGTVDAGSTVSMDDMTAFASVGATDATMLSAAVFRSELARLDEAGEAADFVFDSLDSHFTREQLDGRLGRLETSLRTRGHGAETIAIIRGIADRTYSIGFPPEIPLGERVLWPATDAESAGMEDARFVRFRDDDGSVTFYATYTAYSGSVISQQLLATKDFQQFTSVPLVGRAAANKGLALFPRRIHGRFAAMSRSDRESNTVAYSDDLSVWTDVRPCQQPVEAWEALQLGNCGSPIETDAGWVVLTHGVGPMRTYSIGAILLDLDDPTQMLGRLRRPLLSPTESERDGYVPNVVYSCGALVHGDTLVIPYGISDAAIGIATVALPELLDTLTGGGR